MVCGWLVVVQHGPETVEDGVGGVCRANCNYFKPSDKCQASLNSGLTFMIHGRTYMYS